MGAFDNDYNPPKRARLLEWHAQQEFPILPIPMRTAAISTGT